MKLQELIDKIIATWEEPPMYIYEGYSFAWRDGNDYYGSIGTAVALNGFDIKGHIEDRSVRSAICGMSWYDLMHFEMAICSLCDGNVVRYNYYANACGLPFAPYKYLPKITELNYEILKTLL